MVYILNCWLVILCKLLLCWGVACGTNMGRWKVNNSTSNRRIIIDAAGPSCVVGPTPFLYWILDI